MTSTDAILSAGSGVLADEFDVDKGAYGAFGGAGSTPDSLLMASRSAASSVDDFRGRGSGIGLNGCSIRPSSRRSSRELPLVGVPVPAVLLLRGGNTCAVNFVLFLRLLAATSTDVGVTTRPRLAVRAWPLGRLVFVPGVWGGVVDVPSTLRTLPAEYILPMVAER